MSDHPEPLSSAPRPPARRGRRVLRDIAIAVVGVAAGIGVMLAVTDDGGDGSRATIDVPEAAPTAAIPEPFSVRGDAAAVSTPAADPADAVDRFLTAEADGDWEISFALLDDASREQYGDPARWRNAHADFFPVTSHEILEVDGDEVVTAIRWRSSLDEVIGLVPAQGTVTWPVIRTDDGFLVDFDGARAEPIHPDDAGAIDAVDAWLDAVQNCSDPVDAGLQYRGSLVATADLRREVDALCATDASATAAAVRPLDPTEGSALASAFGAEAIGWARAVSVDGLGPDPVLAPVDDEWIVVGLVRG